MQGIFCIHKEVGPTSHDVIDSLRRITGIKKIGHAGTLDPLASGVLVVGIGREATKKLGGIVKTEKEYIATIRLGEESTTDDNEGEKKVAADYIQPTRKDIEKIIPMFVGEIEQVPPQFSAIKINGRSAYKKARRGETVELKPRTVFIKQIKIINYEWPVLEVRAETGPGVYIRSLARDIGEKLKTGGYLKSLQRTRVGDYTIQDSLKLEDFEKKWKKLE